MATASLGFPVKVITNPRNLAGVIGLGLTETGFFLNQPFEDSLEGTHRAGMVHGSFLGRHSNSIVPARIDTCTLAPKKGNHRSDVLFGGSSQGPVGRPTWATREGLCT